MGSMHRELVRKLSSPQPFPQQCKEAQTAYTWGTHSGPEKNQDTRVADNY